MAVVCTLSNHWKYQLAKKQVDVNADTFKIILMNDTFAFDKDAHATLADVISSPSAELATGYGNAECVTLLPAETCPTVGKPK